MVKPKFLNKHVIVTGGALSIGYEIVRQFCNEQAMVSILDYNPYALERACSQLANEGCKVNPFCVDISNQDQVTEAVNQAETISPIDILINNAGICDVTPFLEIEPDEWCKTLNINLSGVFYVSQSVCRYMVKRKSGVVINMSSKNGLDAEFGHAHYNASKAGVILLTKTMAIELAHLGIRCNAVCPGYVRTAININVDSDDFVDKFASQYIPMNRVGSVNDIAPMFLFLASEEAKYITGQTFVVDGGQLAGQKPWKDVIENAGN